MISGKETSAAFNVNTAPHDPTQTYKGPMSTGHDGLEIVAVTPGSVNISTAVTVFSKPSLQDETLAAIASITIPDSPTYSAQDVNVSTPIRSSTPPILRQQHASMSKYAYTGRPACNVQSSSTAGGSIATPKVSKCTLVCKTLGVNVTRGVHVNPYFPDRNDPFNPDFEPVTTNVTGSVHVTVANVVQSEGTLATVEGRPTTQSSEPPPVRGPRIRSASKLKPGAGPKRGRRSRSGSARGRLLLPRPGTPPLPTRKAPLYGPSVIDLTLPRIPLKVPVLQPALREAVGPLWSREKVDEALVQERFRAKMRGPLGKMDPDQQIRFRELAEAAGIATEGKTEAESIALLGVLERMLVQAQTEKDPKGPLGAAATIPAPGDPPTTTRNVFELTTAKSSVRRALSVGSPTTTVAGASARDPLGLGEPSFASKPAFKQSQFHTGLLGPGPLQACTGTFGSTMRGVTDSATAPPSTW
jgi:hypothetical protein